MTTASGQRHGAGRVLRLGLYVTLLSVVGLILIARSLAAGFSERTLLFGQQLGAWQVFARRGTDVTLNGQQFSLYTTTLQQPVSKVVEDFAQLCGSSSSLAADQLAGSLEAPAARAAIMRLLVGREERGDAEGTVLCFAGLGEGGMSGLLARFSRSAEHLDASELGALRYLYARKVANGTHVIFVTALGALPLLRLMPPADRDAEGVDPIVARSKDSVRFIAAQAFGTPLSFTAYRSKRGAAELAGEHNLTAEPRGDCARAADERALDVALFRLVASGRLSARVSTADRDGVRRNDCPGALAPAHWLA
jgi:hypothetical protein